MEMDRNAAEQRIKGPAVGIVFTAVVGGLFQLANLGTTLLGASLLPLLGGESDGVLALASLVFGVVGAVIGLGVAAFLVWGALRMMRLESWGVALATCIVALVPFVSPCCLIGLPFGIWGLVVINDQAVKGAFR